MGNSSGLRRANKRSTSKEEAAPEWLTRAIADAEKFSKLHPEIDPSDVLHILTHMYRPFGSGKRFFSRPLKSGARVV